MGLYKDGWLPALLANIISEEVTDNGKHSSLQCYDKNIAVKSFIVQDPAVGLHYQTFRSQDYWFIVISWSVGHGLSL